MNNFQVTNASHSGKIKASIVSRGLLELFWAVPCDSAIRAFSLNFPPNSSLFDVFTPSSRPGFCSTAGGQDMLGADREIWNKETNGPSMSSRPQLKTLCNGLALPTDNRQEAFRELINFGWQGKRIAYYPCVPGTRHW